MAQVVKRLALLICAALVSLPAVASCLTWSTLNVVDSTPTTSNVTSAGTIKFPYAVSKYTGTGTTRTPDPVSGNLLPMVAWQLRTRQVITTIAGFNNDPTYSMGLNSDTVYPNGLWRFEAVVDYWSWIGSDDSHDNAFNYRLLGHGDGAQTQEFFNVGLLLLPSRRNASGSYYPAVDYDPTANWTSTIATGPSGLDNQSVGERLIVHAQGGKGADGKFWYAYVITQSFRQGPALSSARDVGSAKVTGLATAPGICLQLVHHPTTHYVGLPCFGQVGTGIGSAGGVGDILTPSQPTYPKNLDVGTIWQAWAGYQENLTVLPDLPDPGQDTSWTVSPTSTPSPTIAVDPGIPGVDWQGTLQSIMGPLNGAFSPFTWPFTVFASWETTP